MPSAVTPITPSAKPVADSTITPRCIIVGLVLSVIFSFIIPYVDVYLSDTFLGAQHLPPGAVFMLFALVVLVNPLLRAIGKRLPFGNRLPFSRVELLMIYCMLLFSTLVPGHGAENVFIPVIVTPSYYASPENKWEDLMFKHIPTWFAPRDKTTVTHFFEGLPPGQNLPWHDWYGPLIIWGGFTLVLYALVLFLSVLFRRQWVDREKLSFPLVALPMEMTAETNHPLRRGAFFGSRAMWIGFGIAVLLQLQTGLKFYFPQFPGFTLMYDFSPMFREPPWNAVGWTPGFIYPMVVGVSVILRQEVSFSLWFFFWFTKVQHVIAALFGVKGAQNPTTWGEPGWLGNQPVGGYIAYVALSFYAARGHFADVYRQVTKGAREASDTSEGLSYRVCFYGVIACVAALVGFCVAAGMTLPVALAQILIYIVLAVALTKVVAESGLLFVQATLSATELMVAPVGTAALGPRNLTVGMFIEHSFMTDLRAFIMPSFMQSLKIADLTQMNKARMIGWCSVAVLLATVISYWANLKLVYTYGGMKCNSWYVQGAGPGGFQLLQSYLMSPRTPSAANLLGLGAGGGFTLLLFALRQRFVWFQLHPVGFVMMQTYPLKCLWFSIFIGWLIKSVVLRYGGPKGLLAATPIFLGLAFGDTFMMVVWLIVDAICGKHGHYLMPG